MCSRQPCRLRLCPWRRPRRSRCHPLARPRRRPLLQDAELSVRLGVLGGTFDPPHVGHLLAASDAAEALALDKLLFVPAKVPPYKSRTVQASPEQRLEMLNL